MQYTYMLQTLVYLIAEQLEVQLEGGAHILLMHFYECFKAAYWPAYTHCTVKPYGKYRSNILCKEAHDNDDNSTWFVLL